MENKLKITKDLVFDYCDLNKEVDTSQEFTLRDILTICVNSKIHPKTLGKMLRCDYITDYYTESDMGNYVEEDENNLDYLELYFWITKQTYDGIREDSSMWCFHGIGKLGYVPEDVLKYDNLSEKDKKEYRQPFAIEFSPIYKLADLWIKISPKIHVTDYDINPKSKDMDSDIHFTLSITLMDLLYAIFYELSYCGSIKERDAMKDELVNTLKGYEEAKENGTLKTIPHKKVKKTILKNIEKEIKSVNKSKKSKKSKNR